MNKNDGGPAFPADYLVMKNKDPDLCFRREGGMTLRDYFAAHALAHIDAVAVAKISEPKSEIPINLARMAYGIADAMIAERERE